MAWKNLQQTTLVGAILIEHEASMRNDEERIRQVILLNINILFP